MLAKVLPCVCHYSDRDTKESRAFRVMAESKSAHNICTWQYSQWCLVQWTNWAFAHNRRACEKGSCERRTMWERAWAFSLPTWDLWDFMRPCSLICRLHVWQAFSQALRWWGHMPDTACSKSELKTYQRFFPVLKPSSYMQIPETTCLDLSSWHLKANTPFSF